MFFTSQRFECSNIPKSFIENVKNLDYPSQAEAFDTVFKPSKLNTILGYLPYIGNVILFGSALHAYRNEQAGYGNKKALEGAVGVVIDHYTTGGSGRVLVDAGRAVAARATWFAFLDNYILNAPVYEYQQKK